MAQQTINVGASPNDGTGTPLRTAFQYTNSNFSELYTATGPSGNNIVVPGSATITGDLTVDTSTLKVSASTDTVTVGATTTDAKFRVIDANYNGLRVGFLPGTANYNLYDATVHEFRTANVTPQQLYTLQASSSVWYDGAGGTRMTLNATGLGVGTSPSYNIDVLAATLPTISVRSTLAGASNARLYLECAGANSGHITYNRSLQSLQLGANGGTTAQVTLDSVGNVGIGVTPSAWISAVKALQISSYGSVAGSSSNFNILGNLYSSPSGTAYVGNGFGTLLQMTNGQYVFYQAGNNTLGAGASATLNPSMTLDASGNLNIGVTGRTEKLAVYGSSVTQALCLLSGNTAGDVSNSALVVSKFDNNTTTSQVFARFFVNALGSGSGQINANGASQAAFGSYSDSRLKENIVSLPSQLANILSLRPVEFDYKDGSGHQIGFVAQEMQEVYSDAVGEQKGFLTVTGWSKTEARLVSAIKELAAKVQALEAKLA